MYLFDWKTPVLNGALGACHSLELPFVFDTLDTARDLVSADAPTALANALHSAWIRFANTGNPNGDNLPNWPRYDTTTRSVMSLNTTREIVSDPSSARRALWDKIWSTPRRGERL